MQWMMAQLVSLISLLIRPQFFKNWINHYPLDSGAIGFPNTYASLIPWIFHYPVDSAIQRLNNWSLLFRDLCGG